jgi:hypothetical protein
MHVQGEIRVRLMKAGLSESTSLDVACDLADYIAKSSLCKDEVREAYLGLSKDPDHPSVVVRDVS